MVLELFIECSTYTLDIFWIDIFINCSKESFPKGIKYNKNDNSISITKTKEIIKINNISSNELFSKLMYIFINILLINSPNVDMNKQKEYNKMCKITKKDDETLWKKIKPKYNLDNINLIITKINRGLRFKQIISSDIIIENNKIIKINGFEYKNGEWIFKKLIQNKVVSSNKVELCRLEKLVDKYIKVV
jgi:hypothetical protein